MNALEDKEAIRDLMTRYCCRLMLDVMRTGFNVLPRMGLLTVRFSVNGKGRKSCWHLPDAIKNGLETRSLVTAS